MRPTHKQYKISLYTSQSSSGISKGSVSLHPLKRAGRKKTRRRISRASKPHSGQKQLASYRFRMKSQHWHRPPAGWRPTVCWAVFSELQNFQYTQRPAGCLCVQNLSRLSPIQVQVSTELVAELWNTCRSILPKGGPPSSN